MFQLLIFTALVQSAFSYSTGPPCCCFPNPDLMSHTQNGTGGYAVGLYQGQAPVSKVYTGQNITVAINGTNVYKGFNVHVTLGMPDDIFSDSQGNFFIEMPDHQYLECIGNPSGAVVHTITRHDAPRDHDFFTWNAPDVPGNYTVYAVVVVMRLEWYGQETHIKFPFEVVQDPYAATRTSATAAATTKATASTTKAEEPAATDTPTSSAGHVDDFISSVIGFFGVLAGFFFA